MATGGTASFDNEAAAEWFYLIEEAVDPGAVIAEALDDAVAETDDLELEPAQIAVAAAELSASCAGEPSEALPDGVRRWVAEHPHEPHRQEIELAVEAITRVRDDSALSAHWEDELGPGNAWLWNVDDLMARLSRSGTDAPADLHP